MDQAGMLANRGDEIICELGGLYPALCAAQEFEMRKMQPQIAFVRDHCYLFPDIADDLVQVQANGVTAQYNGDPPIPPRTRGLPYKVEDSDATSLILPTLWKDISKRGMFLRTTNTICLDATIEATPTTTVEEKTQTELSVLIDAWSRIRDASTSGLTRNSITR